MTWVVLLILAVQPVISTAGETTEMTLTAETLVHDTAANRSNAIGKAKLVSTNAAINADRILYDRNEHAATAVGNVVARLFDSGSNTVVITADVLSLRFDGDEVDELYFLDGQAVSKKGATHQQMLDATTPDLAKKTGITALLLTGNHLKRVDDHRWHIDSLDLVPCECNFDKPSWKIHATSATIDNKNERASIWNATIWVYGVPMPIWFPWLSLPLTDRATGLLFPKPNFSGLNGWSLEQPIFVTLGRSADLTLTPGYFFGSQPFSLGGNPPTYLETPDGIKGPRLQTEFRYTPTKRIVGRVNLGLFYDFKHVRDPVSPLATLDQIRGLRAEGSWFHLQDFGDGVGLRVEGFMQSDGRIQTDLLTDVIARQAGYLRSSAALTRRTTNSLLGLDVVLRQDIVYGYNLFTSTPRPLSSTAPALGPNPIQRWPALTFALPMRRLGDSPVWFDLHAEAVRHAPLTGQTGDEGTLANEGRLGDNELSECARERMYFVPSVAPSTCKTPLKLGMGDGVYQVGEREARDRVMLFPRLFAAWHPGGAVSLTTWAGYRQAVYLGELSGRTSQRGYGLLSARAETELGRSFFDGSVRHSITPIAEVRAVPFVTQRASSGEASPAPYDEIDLAIPSMAGARVQAITELRQRLVNRAGREFLRLEVGQGYNLVAPESGVTGLGETYGRIAISAWWLSASATARFDPVLARATRLAGGWGLEDGRGDGVSMGYENVLDDGTSRTRQPIDLLFGNRVPLTAQSRAQLVSGGAHARFGPVALRYDVLFLDHVWGSVPRPISTKLTFAYQTVAVGFTPACDCWRVDLSVTNRLLFTPTVPDGYLGGPEFFFNFTASRFGSFGSTN